MNQEWNFPPAIIGAIYAANGEVVGPIPTVSQDELRLKQKAEIRLQNLRRYNKSLEKLVVRKIVKHIICSQDDEINSLLKLETLPRILLEKLLNEFTEIKCHNNNGDLEKFESRLRVLPLLLRRQTRKISFNGLLTFSPTDIHYNDALYSENCTRVLQLVQGQAPNIQRLTINDVKLDLGEYERATGTLTGQMALSLLSLKQLTFLKINNFCILLSDLTEICSSLEGLRCLDVKIKLNINPQHHVEKIKRSFSHLTVFLFTTIYGRFQGSQHSDRSFAQFCIEHLPNLQVVQDFVNWKPLISVQERERHILSVVKRTPSKTSLLQHLRTNPNTIDDWKKFPEVTHLKVELNSIDRDVSHMLKFKNIKSLTLENPESREIVYKFLDHYGQRSLRELSIVFSSDTLSLNISTWRILHSCPKLKKLCLRYVNLVYDIAPSDCHENLSELDWTPTRKSEACLSDILAIPLNLNKFSIHLNGSSDLDTEDLYKVASQIKEKQILHHLNTFEFQFVFNNYKFDKQSQNLKAVYFFNAMKHVAITATSFLSNLASIEFKFHTKNFINIYAYKYLVLKSFDLNDDLNSEVGAAFDWTEDKAFVHRLENYFNF